MCGIAGVFHYRDRRPVDSGVLRAMAAAMRHRGPDDDGFLVGPDVGLAMRRLAVIDPVGSIQPASNRAGTVALVFNGEIYNFRELRAELESLGRRFTTAGDTEVILQAYECWGADVFSRLNGMFALALWDRARRVLVLARDPLGIKPLYLVDDGRRLGFASEVRALIAGGVVTPQVNTERLPDFLNYGFVPAPDTLFAGVSRLLPGHLLECSATGSRLFRFSTRPLPPPRSWSEEAMVDELRDRLRRAVKRQMVADVPVGVLLSGGVDSSALAALMTETATGPVRSFTVGFAEDFAGNELGAARRVARRLGAEHHDLRLTMDDFDAALKETVAHLEEPVTTTSTVPFLALSRLARQQVTVALSGQGADEPFGGYPRHAAEGLSGIASVIPGPLRARLLPELGARLPGAYRVKRGLAALAGGDSARRMDTLFAIRDRTATDQLLRNSAGLDERTSALARLQADIADRPSLDQLLYVDTRFGLVDNLLLYADKLSMAASLEVRVPFLDLELLAFVERIPATIRTSPLRRKRLLKKVVAPWVPADVLRRRKVNFATPVGRWLRGPMQAEARERLLAPDSGCRQYFRPEAVTRLLREHAMGRHDHQRTLFSLLMFELWHEQFIAGVAVRGSGSGSGEAAPSCADA